MRKFSFVFIMFISGQLVYAQLDAVQKVDRALLLQFDQESIGMAHSFVDSCSRMMNGQKHYHCKVFSESAEALWAQCKEMGMAVGSLWPGFFTAWLSEEHIMFLSGDDKLQYIEAPIRMYLLNDQARARNGAALLQAGGLNNTAYNGSGVIMGVIDAGVDWQHADFIDPSNSTSSRIWAIWDQDISVTGGEKTPQGNDAGLSCCNFGVEYLKSEIDAELANPTSSIRNADGLNHGTHVLGSAAGNGNSLSPAQHIGMAPMSDIVFVNTDFSDASIIDALDYLANKSADSSQPIVVNMSLGSDNNAHDGTSALAQAINSFSGTGKVVVVAAGNEGADAKHITGTIAEGATASVDITINAYTANGGSSNDYFQFVVWYENHDSVTATIDGPNGSSTSNGVDAYTGVNTASDGAVTMTNEVNGSNNDRNVNVTIFDYVDTNPPAAGTYTINMTNVDANPPYNNPITYHIWLYSASMSASIAGGNGEYMVGSPGSATSAITVGSYVYKWRWQNYQGSNYSYSGTDFSDTLSDFSSKGPLRDGTTKPELVTEGQGVVSTLSTFSSASNSRRVASEKHFVNQGTSMATPITAGAAALLLQKDNNYTASQVKSLLTSNAKTDAYTGLVPNNAWGYGKLDVFSAMTKALDATSVPTREVLVYDSWGNNSPVSLTGTNQVALKFTPSADGKLTSVLFHVGTGTLSLSGDITFGIYSNNAGIPGTQIGSNFTFDADQIIGNMWMHALNNSSISLAASTDYFVVINLANTSDAWSLLAETSSVDSRSLVNSGSGWATQAFDFRIRPIVSNGDNVAVLPVELIYFKALKEGGNQVRLNWMCAQEINNAGFEVEQLIDGQFQKIGFVKGQGNSLGTTEYDYWVYQLKTGSHYFRLKQIDLDGAFTYSPIEVIATGESQLAKAKVFPNPAHQVLKVEIGRPIQSLKLFNLLGEFVMEVAELNELDISGLAPGTYLLEIWDGQQLLKERVVVE